MRLPLIIISIYLICLPINANSQEIKNKNINLIALDFYEDEYFKPLISDLPKLNFKEISEGSINFGFKSTRCFIRGIIQNNDNSNFSGIVSIDNPTIDKANFIFNNKILQSGDSLTFSSRPLSSKKIAFNFVLMPNQIDTFYIELSNSGEQFHIPIRISDEDSFIETENKEQLIFGVYFGFLLFVLIFNVFYFFVIKDRTSIFYIGYILSLFILQLSLTGYAQKYLWPNSVYLANHINPIFASISIFFLTQFVLKFLEVEKFYPRLKDVIQIISYVLIINSIIGAISEIHAYQTSVLIVNGISFILVLIIIPLSILIWKNKFKPARIFFFAFVFLLISVAVFVLKNAAILPSNMITNYGLQMGSALEVLLLTLAMIDKFNQFKTDAFKRLEEINTLKTEANLVLEKKVLERTKTINEQKEEILSSIRYAKRIQKNILPEKKLIHKLFEENAFVLYQPKDIVSGDFYWIEEIYLGDVKTQIVVVADCTGHGVPGGFMSMLGATLVRQEIKNLLPGDGPHQLLQKISNALQISIQNYENQEDWAITDGMDMAVVFIQEPNIKFAGAKSDLLILFENGEFQRVRGDKNSIAHEQDNAFTMHSLTLSIGDSIYLFTDGMIDQFGGKENKKLGRAGLCQLISNSTSDNFNQQETEMLRKWNDWKAYNEQTDDMCLFAYRF